MKHRTTLCLLAVLVTVAFPKAARAERCSDDSERRSKTSSNNSNNNPSTTSGSGSEPEPVPDEDCIPRDIHWMPGGFGTYFLPSADLGPFYGGGVQFAPYQWSHNNDRFGPSQGTTFLNAALLTSPRSKGALAIFELGATASFERNSSRSWLIPYFGAAFGGLTQSDLGTSVYAYPLGGTHLYWHKNLMIDAEGGYHFPLSDVDRARGPRAQLSLRLSLW